MRSILWKLDVTLVLLVSFTQSAVAQLAVASPKPIIGARMPALSPDGQQLAFVYRGDVWKVSSAGGRALPLTLHLEMDAFPLFSPDGHWVAFGSKRNGNWDIYLVPAEGGSVRQVTYHAADEIPQSWSPDGRRILYSCKLDTTSYGLFEVDVETLRITRLLEDYATLNFPAYARDGRWVAFGRNGFHWTRPRYTGSGAAQIWLLDLAENKARPLTTDTHQHLWSRFLPDSKSLLTVTVDETTPSTSRMGESIERVADSPERTPNLWRFDFEGQRRPLTHFTGGSVRCPTVAAESGDIAFEYERDLWLLRAGQDTPYPIQIYCGGDDKQNTRRREKLSSGATEAEPSPDGKTYAFGLRGDIWTVAVDKPRGLAGRSAEIARRLTEWEGDDSDFVWSRDGKQLYFTSDRLFNTRLYVVDLETLESKCLWNRSEDVAHPILSPDGRTLSFWVSGGEGGLFLLSLENGESRRVVRSPGTHWYGWGGGEVVWSPDSRWLAYTCRGEDQAWNIWIAPAAGGEPFNVTTLNARHGSIGWSPNGKHLFFQSNRDGDGLYVLPLRTETARSADTDLRFERPEADLRIQIDFDGITKRIRKIASVSPHADLTVTAEGTIYFLADGDLWSVSYDGKESKRLSTDGGRSSLRISSDGQTGFYLRGGELWTTKLNERAGAEKVSFAADWEQNVRAERLAAFAQFWRSYHRGFYDPNFHGRDWLAIRRRYEPLLEAVETREEFATLLQMMVGELEASHSELTPAPGGPTAPVTPHLGFTFDYAYDGFGLKVKDVPSGAPGSYAQTAIHPGEYVLAINGREVRLDQNLFRWINDKQDREFEFLVNTQPSKDGARKVRYKVLTPEEWNELTYRNQVDRLRQFVEKESNKKIGYLHLPAMGQNNQVQFEREAYEYVVGKDAMIIDVRFNSGGYIADTLIDWLDRKPRGFVRPRDGAVQPAPTRAWDKPMVVLMNEQSFSNGEIFAYAMRLRKLATLVGMPTPGYVIWTDNLNLVDGTGARMPMSAFYRLDGLPLENYGEKPDVQVWLTPEDWRNGRDPQLAKAIELLQKGSKTDPTPSDSPGLTATGHGSGQ